MIQLKKRKIHFIICVHHTRWQLFKTSKFIYKIHPFRSAEAYFDCLAPQNKPIFESYDYPDVQSAVALKMNEIKEVLPVLETKDAFLKGDVHEMIELKKKSHKQQKQKANQMVEMTSQLKNRDEAFAPHFSKLKQCFYGLVQYCRSEWAILLDISAVDESPLSEPIHLMVNDPKLDPALAQTMTLNHCIAVLILQLTINAAIGSQFIIVDGLDDFIEPCLIA